MTKKPIPAPARKRTSTKKHSMTETQEEKANPYLIGTHQHHLHAMAQELSRIAVSPKAHRSPILGVVSKLVAAAEIVQAAEGTRPPPVQLAPDAFWVVWNTKRDVPMMQHPTRKSALKEAERLAAIEPGTEFFVLESAASVVVHAPKIRSFQRP
ncbi:MAG: hypothetical protein ACEQSH_00330 [Bacteroidia bacterium]